MRKKFWIKLSEDLETVLRETEDEDLTDDESEAVNQAYSLYQKALKLSKAVKTYDRNSPYERMELKEDEWHLFDTGIFCRCLGGHEFEFISPVFVGQRGDGEDEYLVDNQLIDVGDYSDEKIEACLAHHFTSIGDVREINGEKTAELVALYLFKDKLPYDHNGYGIVTEEEADELIRKYMEA